MHIRALRTAPGFDFERRHREGLASRGQVLRAPSPGWLVIPCILALSSVAAAQAGTIASEQKISETAGGLGNVLNPNDQFGYSVTSLGDVDGDGIGDIAVGAPKNGTGGTDQGAVWILFLDANGTVAAQQKIADGTGGFGGNLDSGDEFGIAVAAIGDLDGDEISELAVGVYGDDDGNTDQGAVWILFLNADGTVASQVKISETSGGFGGALGASDHFGRSICPIGDLDNDGVTDLAVGATGDDDGASGAGAVWILFLNSNGTVDAEQKISATAGGFGGTLSGFDDFGVSVAGLGDLNGDGREDLAVGAYQDDDGDNNTGAVWVLFLNVNGTVASEQKISETSGNLGGVLAASDGFGVSLSSPGDLDRNGVEDLFVGSYHDDDGGGDQGAVWVLFLNTSGTVASKTRISATDGGFEGDLDPTDSFGISVSSLEDIDGDGLEDLVAGVFLDDDGGTDQGAVWVLFGDSVVDVIRQQKISDTQGGFTGTLVNGDNFGDSCEFLGDLDGDGNVDLAVGAPGEDAALEQGTTWILFLNADGTVDSSVEITEGVGGFGGVLDPTDWFGSSVTVIGDLDDDGTVDLAVGAMHDDDGGTDCGALWILFMNPDGTVADYQKISATEGGFEGALDDGDRFGVGAGTLGDFDGDGIEDLAVGADMDDDGFLNSGAVWLLLLNADGTVKSELKISATAGGFGGSLSPGDFFGAQIVSLGDIDGSSRTALAVSADGTNGTFSDQGSVWILFLDENGAVDSELEITMGLGGFTGTLASNDRFGGSVANLGDLNHDGVPDLAVGAFGDDDGGNSHGAVWLLLLEPTGTVSSALKISDTAGGFTGVLGDSYRFGEDVSAADIDGDGRVDLAVGTEADNNGGVSRGSVWILFLNDGTLNLIDTTTWTGATDTEWSDDTNWTGDAPDATTTAIIPDAATTPNDPQVTNNSEACDSLWIQLGGTLELAGGADNLGIFGGATVSGPITGTGELVLEAAGTLAGSSTISAASGVRADANLVMQGGRANSPFTITETLTAAADLALGASSAISIGTSLDVAGSLDVQGLLEVDGPIDVDGDLTGSDEAIITTSSGNCTLSVGGDDFHFPGVLDSCALVFDNPTSEQIVIDAAGSIQSALIVDTAGVVLIDVASLTIPGGIEVRSGTLDVAGNELIASGADPVVIESGGTLAIGSCGRLRLEANAFTVEAGGMLRLVGTRGCPAVVRGFNGGGYSFVLEDGAALEALNFEFQEMGPNGIVIEDGVAIASAPRDLRSGLFDRPAANGVLLDVTRATQARFRYLRFENSLGATNAKNVRVGATSAPIEMVFWSGAFGGEPFEDDPGIGEPGLLEWGLEFWGGPAVVTPKIAVPGPSSVPPPLIVGTGSGFRAVDVVLESLASRGSRSSGVTLTLELDRGVHAPFVIEGSALPLARLRLVARPGARIDTAGEPVRIAGLARGTRVELVGITFNSGGASHPALVIEDCTGTVVLEDARIEGDLVLSSATSVYLRTCTIDALLLESASHARACGGEFDEAELRCGSTLVTLGTACEPLVWPNSNWRALERPLTLQVLRPRPILEFLGSQARR